jgi:hypothetical protein
MRQDPGDSGVDLRLDATLLRGEVDEGDRHEVVPGLSAAGL